MTTLTGKIRESATVSIVLSVLMIIGGVLAIVVPPVAGLAVTVMLGWLLIVTGVLHLGLAWRGHGAWAAIGEVAVAVLYGAIGFYLLTRPVAGLASLTLALAGYLTAKAVVEAAIAFSLRLLPGSGWLIVDAIVTVALATVIVSAWPASAAWAVGALVGVAMVSSGFARLMMSVAARQLVA